MSHVADLIKEERVSFVLPYASEMAYLHISPKDKALCYTIDKGYIESSSADACFSFAMFLSKVKGGEFRRVGKMDKIRLRSGGFVYRYRVQFSNVLTLLRILNHFSINLVVLRSFRVGVQQTKCCSDRLISLESYAGILGCMSTGVEDWLTDCCILQLMLLAQERGVDMVIPKRPDMYYTDGALNRAPYLMIKESKNRKLVILPNRLLHSIKVAGAEVHLVSDVLVALHDKLLVGYGAHVSGEFTPFYGFTDRNLYCDLLGKDMMHHASNKRP